MKDSGSWGWGEVGLSNFKSRFIGARAPINQNATADVKAFLYFACGLSFLFLLLIAGVVMPYGK
jgi:hypothetical protein